MSFSEGIEPGGRIDARASTLSYLMGGHLRPALEAPDETRFGRLVAAASPTAATCDLE